MEQTQLFFSTCSDDHSAEDFRALKTKKEKGKQKAKKEKGNEKWERIARRIKGHDV